MRLKLKELKLISKWYDLASKYEDLEDEENIDLYDKILAELDGYEEDEVEEDNSDEDYLYEKDYGHEEEED